MVGKRVKELRMKRGLSQEDLGTAVGVTKVSVCGYENGTRLPSLENLIKIADVPETTTDYLLGREIPVWTDDDDNYIGSVSHDDICFITELKHYPSLYNKILKDVRRSASIISKKFTK